MTAAGLMTDAEQALIDLAKQTDTWTAPDGVENLTNPPDLPESFATNPGAKTYFDAFPRSVKRGILE